MGFRDFSLMRWDLRVEGKKQVFVFLRNGWESDEMGVGNT